MRKEQADVVVVGGGIMGCLTAWEAARRGLSVILLDRSRPGHTRGSSHGASRIFRYTYPHPDHVHLLHLADQAWTRLEREARVGLRTRCPGIDFAHRDHPYLRQGREALEQAGRPWELLEPGPLRARHPQFSPPADHLALVQPEAAVLAARASLEAGWRLARRDGGRLHPDTLIQQLDLESDQPTAVASDSYFQGRRLIVTAGPWLGGLLPSPWRERLKVTREGYALFPASDAASSLPGQLPVFLIHEGEETFYGLPSLEGASLKFARHGGGEEVDPERPPGDPIPPSLARRLIGLVRRWLPSVEGRITETRGCLYTNTPDQDFLLAPLAEREDVVVGGGFSGHGFKFAPLVGELLVQRAMGEPWPQAAARFLAARLQP